MGFNFINVCVRIHMSMAKERSITSVIKGD